MGGVHQSWSVYICTFSTLPGDTALLLAKSTTTRKSKCSLICFSQPTTTLQIAFDMTPYSLV